MQARCLKTSSSPIDGFILQGQTSWGKAGAASRSFAVIIVVPSSPYVRYSRSAFWQGRQAALIRLPNTHQFTYSSLNPNNIEAYIIAYIIP